MKEGIKMKVKVNQEKCFGCSACQAVVPEVFDMNDEGLAHVIVDTVPKDKESDVKEALHNCPAEAIEEVK